MAKFCTKSSRTPTEKHFGDVGIVDKYEDDNNNNHIIIIITVIMHDVSILSFILTCKCCCVAPEMSA